ncbi:MFS general substrate transporter [Pholiota conissans]|uniref:MFS general substrate transporter n=1 Tax=Pholiota conissans TaxID=109636 RepID=A0A9P6CYE2_9AGAR|nr:MFS general substrate transporter [Pholiota conissans]
MPRRVVTPTRLHYSIHGTAQPRLKINVINGTTEETSCKAPPTAAVDQLKSRSDILDIASSSPADDEKLAPQDSSQDFAQDNVPDGGLRAWLTVVGAFLLQFCGFGYTAAFGVYQDYYTRVHITNASASAISWIGSINAFILIASGLYAGPLYDRGYFYHLLYGGSFLSVFSLFMLSLTKPNHFYQNLLTQGIGLAIGGGLIYVPGIAIISQYFSKKRALAMTIVVSGSSLGAIVHPIMLNNLLASDLGFQNTVRASAGLVTGVLVVACLLLRPRYLSKSTIATPPIWRSARNFYSEWSFIAISAGGFFFTIGMYFPLFYLQLDAIKRGVSENFSFYALVIMNASNLIGCLAPTPFIHTFGITNMVVVAAGCYSALIFAMTGLSNVPSVVVFAILYGFLSGIFASLQAPLIAIARMGIAFTCFALGALVGPPIHGALLTDKFIWWRPALESAVLAMAGTAFFASINFVVKYPHAADSDVPLNLEIHQGP